MAGIERLKVLINDVLAAFFTFCDGTPEAADALGVLHEMALYVPALFEDVRRHVFTKFLPRLREPALNVDIKKTALLFLCSVVRDITEAQLRSIMDCLAELVEILMECLLQIQAPLTV